MQTPREVAQSALIKFRRTGTWPDLYLKQEGSQLSDEDMALATAITYGTLQNLTMIDFYIGAFSSMKLNKIMPQVLDAVRIAVYQMIYMDRIPESAAVNESVAMIKKQTNPRAVGFANALLRKIAQNKNELPQPDKADLTQYYAIKYSHPDWFVTAMRKRLGDEQCAKLLEANNMQAPATARVNTLKNTPAQLLELLSKQGINAEIHPKMQNVLVFPNLKNVIQSNLFEEGRFYIQDIASQLAVHALAPSADADVIDMCSAPGGKALIAAQIMGCKGHILATDIYPHKVDIIKKNATRYGCTIIEPALMDATLHISAMESSADFVICDVPCSGMGIIRKKPDIRFKKQESLAGLPSTQLSILQNAASYLKIGGSLVYSTCTVLKQENEDVVSRFLAQNSNFKSEPFAIPIYGEADNGMCTLFPHIHGTDGFFIAKIKKIK